MSTLTFLREEIRSLKERCQQHLLNNSQVVVRACDEPGPCPICNGAMRVQKTVPHSGKTLKQGMFHVRETVHVCAAKCRHPSGALVAQRAESVRRQIIPGRSIGYDVLVFIGLSRFMQYRQREEIRHDLKQNYGLGISTGTISELSKLFLDYLQDLHQAKANQFKAAMAEDGGWPLHIDTTGEHGRGTLLVAYSGWRNWVLGAWKISTERTDAMLPHLRDVVRRFDFPVAVMRDLGRAMIRTAEALTSDHEKPIPINACHLHFLSDVGGDMLDKSHGELRKLFRRFKVLSNLRKLSRDIGLNLSEDIKMVREELKNWQECEDAFLPDGKVGLGVVRSMAQWIIDYCADSTGQDFPFDRPYLDMYDRCLTIRRATENFLKNQPKDKEVHKALVRLSRLLSPLVSELPFEAVARNLRRRAALFEELRKALRLNKKDKSSNQNTNMESVSAESARQELSDIKADVENLTKSLRDRKNKTKINKDLKQAIDIILNHLEKHGQYLWGHVIALPHEIGGGIRLVARTNNCLESLFGEMKHGERRRSGRKILTQDFEHLPAAAALVKNLNHTDYVTILCGSIDSLDRAFADLDAERQRKHLDGQTSKSEKSNHTSATEIVSASLPSVDRRLIRTEAMNNKIKAAAGHA